jgi:hypothetical protein
MPGNTAKKITSVKSFVDEITRMRSDHPSIGAEQWFFRGQKCSSWDVRPSVFRDNCLIDEHVIIDRARRQNPLEFRDCSGNFEILTKLQHYGLGTRLLDVTLNPLVALFFATEPSSEFTKNKNGQYTFQEHDGCVYYRFVSGCSLRDLQIRIALEVPFVELGKSLSLEQFYKRLLEDHSITEKEHEDLADNEYQMGIKLLQTNSFIVSTNSNARLIQQRGAFLISPSINVKTGREVKTSILSKASADLAKEFEGSFLIESNVKESIREELDFFNVNEATLFPELEHQMRYIQSQMNNHAGTVEDYTQYIRVTNRNSRVYENINEQDVRKSIQEILHAEKEELKQGVVKSIMENQELDWQTKESAISKMRRAVSKHLSEVYSAVDSKSKANEIVDRLLSLN